MNATKPKTTPGPWIVCEPYTDRAVFPIGYARGDGATNIIAEVNSQGGTPDQQRANAALIASAPELAARIANLESLLAEKQRQCDRLTDAGQTAAINLTNLATQIVTLRRALKATLQDLEHTARPELHDDPAWAGRDSRKLAIAALGERRTE